MTSSTEPLVVPESGAVWADWSTIGVGDLVELKDSRVWQCTDRHGDVVKVEREDGKVYEGMPTGQVKVIDTAARAMEQATALVQVHLDGQTIATKDAEGRWLVPATFPDPASLLSHIYTLHGVVVQPQRGLPDDQGLRSILRKHDRLHRPEFKGKEYVNHYHDPDFHREREGGLPTGLRAPR
jgi:hypothetical protein